MLIHGLKESRQIVQEHKCLLRPQFLQSSGWKQHCISGKLCCFTKYCSLGYKPMSNSSDKGIISNAVTEKGTKITQQLEPVKDKLIHKPKYSLIIHQDTVSCWQCCPFTCLTTQRDLKPRLPSAKLFLESFKRANMQRPCSTRLPFQLVLTLQPRAFFFVHAKWDMASLSRVPSQIPFTFLQICHWNL